MENDYCCFHSVVVIVWKYRKCRHGKYGRWYCYSKVCPRFEFSSWRLISILWDRNFQSRGIGDFGDVVVPLGESSRIFNLSVPEKRLI